MAAGDDLSVSVVLSLTAEQFAAALAQARERFGDAMDDIIDAADEAGDGVDRAFRQLGIRSTPQVEAEIAALERAYETLRDAGTVSVEDLGRAQDALGERTRALREEIDGVGEEADEAGGQLSGFTGALLSLDVLARGADWLAGQVGDLTELADAWANVKVEIGLVNDTAGEAADALSEVRGVAQETSSDLGATSSLYAAIRRALKSLGDEQTSSIDLTRTITQSFQISGATAAESSGGIRQLSQALASGQLRGDEFNSVMEQAPRLSQALADSLGVTTGELRAMAEAGELTAQTVIRALTDQAQQIAAEAALLPDTFARAGQRFMNSLTAVVGGLNEATRASELYAAGVDLLADGIVLAARGIEAAGGVVIGIIELFGRIPGPVYAALGAMVALGGGAAALALNLGAVSGALTTLALAVTSLALGAWAKLTAAIGAAGTALRALWVLALANPLTAVATALAVVTVGVLAYRAAAEETLASLGRLREELGGQLTELEGLQRALRTAATDSEAYAEAERRLAETVPGLTLSLNEQGQVVARVGEGYEDNAQALQAYIAETRQADQTALLQQLALAYREHERNSAALERHKTKLSEVYGIGEQNRNFWQRLALSMGGVTGEVDRLNRRQAELAGETNKSRVAFRTLAIEVLQSGQSIEELRAALERLGVPEDVIAGLVAAFGELGEAALEGLSKAQRAVVQSAAEAAQAVQPAIAAVGAEIERLDGEIADHQQRLAAAQQAEAAGWQRVAEAARGTYSARITEIAAYEAAEREATARGTQNQRVAAQLLVDLQRQVNGERLAAIREYQAQALQLVDAEYDRRLDAARRVGADERAIEIERLTAKRDTLRQIEADYRSHIDTLNAEAQRHLAEVQRIEDQIRALKMSTEDRIRELARGAMSDYEAYHDRRRQAAETASQAERALAQGDFDLAQELARKSADLWAANAREIKEGEQVLVSRNQATAEAMRGVAAAAGIQEKALRGAQAAAQAQAEATQSAAQEMEADWQQVAERLKAIEGQLAGELAIKLSLDREAVDAQVNELATALQQREFYLHIQADLQAFTASLAEAEQLVQKDPLQLAVVLERGGETAAELQRYVAELGDEAPLELRIATEQLGPAIEAARTELQALEVPTESRHRVELDDREARSRISQLQRPTTSTHTIIVREVKANAAGGPVRALAAGGPTFPAPRWTIVPGVGDRDSVPAALPLGAYVLRKAAVRRYGGLLDRLEALRLATGGSVAAMLMPGERLFDPAETSRLGLGLLEGLNSLRIPRAALAAAIDSFTAPVQRFAAGGYAGAAIPAAAAPPTGAARDSIDINIRSTRRAAQVQGSREQARALAAVLDDLARGA